MAGCMPQTKAEIKNTDINGTFYVQHPYQEVYRDLRDVVENIKPGNFMLQENVDSELYTDNKTAEIIRKSYPMIGQTSVLLYIEISEDVSPNTSKVTMWSASPLGTMYADKVKEFLAKY